MQHPPLRRIPSPEAHLPSRSSRGALTDRVTQRWVRLTGRRIELPSTRWLEGPVGDPEGIGTDFFDRWAARTGLVVGARGARAGLLPDFDALAGPSFDPARVHPAVRDFYEATSEYELDVWSEWSGAFRPFGGLLSLLFSRRLGQLNVPLNPLDTSQGMTSEVLHLTDPTTGRHRCAAWNRELRRTGQVLYSGAYSVAEVPGHPDPCVRVVFPLPNGSAVVLLAPSVDADGALTIRSEGERFGDPGFYFTVAGEGSEAWARYVRTMRESIRVYPAEGGETRADHVLRIFGTVFLRLHYRMRRRPSPGTD